MNSRFLLMIFIYLCFGLPVFHDPSLSWKYRICFDCLQFSSLFKWPAHFMLRWVSKSYMPGSLDFSKMNLFHKCYHDMKFCILCNWCIMYLTSFGYPLCRLFKFLHKFCIKNHCLIHFYIKNYCPMYFYIKNHCPMYFYIKNYCLMYFYIKKSLYNAFLYKKSLSNEEGWENYGMVHCTQVSQAIGLMSRVFANGLGDRGSIPGQVIPKT